MARPRSCQSRPAAHTSHASSASLNPMKDFNPGEPAHQVHRLSPRALEVVEEVMNDTSKPAKDRLEAATLVLACAHGSPSQEIMNTSRKRPIDEFSDDEILAILSSAATEVQASGPIFPGSADESLVSYARPGGCDLERGL